MAHVDSPYEYKRLRHPRSFRLLHITRSWTDIDVPNLHGTLQEASIDTPPSYTAISYTWGDAKFSEQIILDGHGYLSITANSAVALRRLLRDARKIVVWIDAICIDQSSDSRSLQERSQQLQMMDEIYARATMVMVHLGEGDKSIRAAVAAMSKLAVMHLIAHARGPFKDRRMRWDEKYALGIFKPTREKPYGTLQSFFKHPWFRRIWVVQEVAVGRRVVFYCGKDLITMNVVLLGSQADASMSRQNLALSGHWSIYLRGPRALQKCIENSRKAQPHPIELYGIMHIATFRSATKPQDKVYGVYGLAKRLGFNLPVPGYTKPIPILYAETTRCIIEQDHSLNMLSTINGSGIEKGLPSWSLDYSDRDSQEELDIIAGLHAPFQSAGDSQYMLSFSSDGKRLHLLGRRLDRISACGLSCAAYSADLPTSGPSFNSGRGLLSFCNAIPSWARIVAQMSEYCTEESMETVFTKTLTCNRFIASPLTPDIQEKITRWIAFITACHEDSRLTLDGTGVLNMLDFIQDPEMQGIAEGAFVSCIGRKMFSSSYLDLGMAPSRAREGDLIVLFRGSPAPFVLRECEEGFQLIGAACVHGIMDGEAWVGLSSDDDEWFTLI